jgi:two-component system sensor histidine kinase YesM
LQQIRRRLEGEETENVGLGFGLNNVHQRIRLHYGPCYGLQIDSKLGQGTTVTIRIPVAADEKTDKIS